MYTQQLQEINFVLTECHSVLIMIQNFEIANLSAAVTSTCICIHLLFILTYMYSVCVFIYAGLILPAHMSVSFSRPDPIALQVKVSPNHVFTKTTNLTFAWYHNNSDLSALPHNTGSGVIFNESESTWIVIDSSVYHNAAGTYEARLKKLAFERPTYPAGSLRITKKLGCSKIALQALKNYAILRPAIFHVAESGRSNTILCSLQHLNCFLVIRFYLHFDSTNEMYTLYLS